jgi:ubiquinone/menaquinone biosynthesis C-methylase UbiE
MLAHQYLMENENEALRMDLKTDPEELVRQARWAGLTPGMRIADIGCGSGKTTHLLAKLAEPHGESVGIDNSRQRISYARKHYASTKTRFLCRNLEDPMGDLGKFDFIWLRFVLEYFRSSSFDIVKKLTGILNPGGILCLIDLDLNCLNHYGMPKALESSLIGVIRELEEKKDFDPYAGRRLYSYLYDLNYRSIRVDLSAHHLIYGKLSRKDEFNWITKVLVAAKDSGYDFSRDFCDGFDGFFESFKKFFRDPRRFTYTPVVACAGTAPLLYEL